MYLNFQSLFIGSYQPSKDLLLRFYAYYKQATLGRNNQPKPNFWDVVNRAKWQAWENLGDMPKEQAMQEYVNELKKVIFNYSFLIIILISRCLVTYIVFFF